MKRFSDKNRVKTKNESKWSDPKIATFALEQSAISRTGSIQNTFAFNQLKQDFL